ncbi:hypothetical protein JTB14_004458 [Gonioctena quinquepunctata]|nr:hypothetical protein JTB14_004458 [Gonioctena quinquepunctata]
MKLIAQRDQIAPVVGIAILPTSVGIKLIAQRDQIASAVGTTIRPTSVGIKHIAQRDQIASVVGTTILPITVLYRLLKPPLQSHKGRKRADKEKNETSIL